MRKAPALLLSSVILLSLSSCKRDSAPSVPELQEEASEELKLPKEEAKTFREAHAHLPENWNPHRGDLGEPFYPGDYLTQGLYGLYYQDGVHGDREGRLFEKFGIYPEMAAGEPVDVTASAAAEHPEFGIPQDSKNGYAYEISLNPDARWENGKPITGETYVESMKRLLDPGLLNDRAPDFYEGPYALAGAEDYYFQGTTELRSYRQLQEDLGGPQKVLDRYGKKDGILNWAASFGAQYDFAAFPWKPGQPVDPDGFSLEAEDKFYFSGMTAKALLEFQQKAWMLLGYDKAQTEALSREHCFLEYSYPSEVSFSQVGIYASGEQKLTLVFREPVEPFYLKYFLTENWLVEPELYDACIRQGETEKISLYGTSPETTCSYGPYRLEELDKGKSMTFLRNPNWYGYGDTNHSYRDPETGKLRPMYETTRIQAVVLESALDQKKNFELGKLSVYGLQPEDYKVFRNQKNCYRDPSGQILHLILNGDLQAMERREADKTFDPASRDLQTLTLPAFRKAISLSIDREVLASRMHPAYRGAYGLLSGAYLSDPEENQAYRDTEEGRMALCRAYAVDPQSFGGDWKAAADSITGYDLPAARELLGLAFRQALEKGFVTDLDGDGICDQRIDLELCIEEKSPMMTGLVSFLKEAFAQAAKGTPFQEKLSIHLSEPYGDGWYDAFAAGETEAVLAGWEGSFLDPFAMTELYTDGIHQYDSPWFPADQIPMTLELPGFQSPLTLSLRQWSQGLNGKTICQGDGEYRFGPLEASQDLRLQILAGIEERVLASNDYIPLLETSSIHLLSEQVKYAGKAYHPVMGHGGLAYLQYACTDDGWQEGLSKQEGKKSR